MTENQLIAKLKELRQIKPRQDWVSLTKNQILGPAYWSGRQEETKPSFSFASFLAEIIKGERFILQHKPVFATLVFLAVLIGVFGFAKNSLPGDYLYSIKKIAEKSQAVFIPEKDQLINNLKLSNKRLDDLTKVAESNSVKNLGPAINEFQASVSKVAESLTQAEKNPQIVKEIAFGVKKLEERAEKVKSLGIEIGDNKELENALAQLVKEQIKDLENKTLSQEQQEILEQAKESYEKGDYSQALEKILESR